MVGTRIRLFVRGFEIPGAKFAYISVIHHCQGFEQSTVPRPIRVRGSPLQDKLIDAGMTVLMYI